MKWLSVSAYLYIRYMAYALKSDENLTLIIYNGQQVGLILSDLDKTEWFAIEDIDGKKKVVLGPYGSWEEAFKAFKKHRRIGGKERER